MSAVVSRRSLLGWLAAIPFAKLAPELAPKVEAAVTTMGEYAATFKGNAFKIAMVFKGYELGPEEVKAMVDCGIKDPGMYGMQAFFPKDET